MAEILYRYILDEGDGLKYENIQEHKSTFFGYTITIPAGRKSDGATWARDLGANETGWRNTWGKVVKWLLHSKSVVKTDAWFVHDELCLKGSFDCGTRIPNIICSAVISWLLYKDGYKKEAFTWFFPTFFAGGGECKKNGMFWVKKVKK